MVALEIICGSTGMLEEYDIVLEKEINSLALEVYEKVRKEKHATGHL